MHPMFWDVSPHPFEAGPADAGGTRSMTLTPNLKCICLLAALGVGYMLILVPPHLTGSADADMLAALYGSRDFQPHGKSGVPFMAIRASTFVFLVDDADTLAIRKDQTRPSP